MNIQKIQIDWINIPVHKFLDDQRIFLTDAAIICGGFHNIMEHDNKCWERFLWKLQILYGKIYERYLITLSLSDEILGKQEISMWMWKILEDIDMMKEFCLQKKDFNY